MGRLGQGETVRILLAIGDGPSLCTRLAKEAGGGFAWAAVGRLEQALELLRHERWDVVLLDPYLPDSEGPTSVVRLRAAAPDIAVLIVSAKADEREALAFLEAGAQDYLDRIDLVSDTLLRAIRYALGRMRAAMRLSGLISRDRPMALVERATFAARPSLVDENAAAKRPDMAESLRRALARDELVLYYQPQVSPCDGAVAGVEAMIRWRQAETELPAAERFLPLAEERGLIEPVGGWALRTAGAQLGRWQADGLTTGRIAVTLAARELLGRDPGESLPRLLGVSGRDAAALELVDGARGAQEETEPVDLARLIVLGARVTIDDVVADRAALNRLKRPPVEILKLDRSFAQHLEREPWDTAIVTSVIELGHDLGLKTVAEGIETGRQFGFLRRQGCDAVQGNLVCPPLPADAFAAWLRGRKNNANLASAAGA